MKQIEDRVQLTIVADAPIGVKDCVRGTLCRQDDQLFRFDETQPWFGRSATQTLMKRNNLRITKKKDGSYRVAMAIPAEMKEPKAVGDLLYAKYEQAQEWFFGYLQREEQREQPSPKKTLPLPSLVGRE